MVVACEGYKTNGRCARVRRGTSRRLKRWSPVKGIKTGRGGVGKARGQARFASPQAIISRRLASAGQAPLVSLDGIFVQEQEKSNSAGAELLTVILFRHAPCRTESLCDALPTKPHRTDQNLMNPIRNELEGTISALERVIMPPVSISGRPYCRVVSIATTKQYPGTGFAWRPYCRRIGTLHGVPHARANGFAGQLVTDGGGRDALRGTVGHCGRPQHHPGQRARRYR